MINTGLLLLIAVTGICPQTRTNWRTSRKVVEIQKRLVSEIQLNRDGSVLVSASSTEKTAVVWDTASGKKLRELACPEDLIHLAISPDGSQIAATASDGSVRAWDTSSGKELWSRKSDAWDLCYAADGKTLVIARDSVRVLDALTGEVKTEVKELCDAVAIDPTGKFLVGTAQDDPKDVSVWNLAESKVERKLVGIGAGQRYVFSAAGHFASKTSDDVEIENFETDECLRIVTCNCFAFSADGKLVLLGTEEGKVSLQPPNKDREFAAIKVGSPVNEVCISGDSMRIAAATSDGISIWAPQE